MQTPEQIAEAQERRIVRFTNIDNESFTHSFRGVSITVFAGESYPCRFPEADHLATHLARKILARKKKSMKITERNGIMLWTQPEIDKMKEEIITEIASETNNRMTAEEARQKDLENLKTKYSGGNVKTVMPAPTAQVTKQDVIASLKERGSKVDVTKTKEELLQQLMALEATGA